MPGIDDGEIATIDGLLPAGMQLARAVTALAANGMALEDRLAVPVDRELDRESAIGMTEETLGLDRPIEVQVALLISRRQVKPPLLAVPRNRRLKQSALMLDEVRYTARARSQRVYFTSASTCASGSPFSSRTASR